MLNDAIVSIMHIRKPEHSQLLPNVQVILRDEIAVVIITDSFRTIHFNSTLCFCVCLQGSLTYSKCGLTKIE
jgi:hypothetical protein